MMKDKNYYETQASQEEYLDWYKSTKQEENYQRPSVGINIALFAYDGKRKDIVFLIVKRKRNPYKDIFGLPGTFIRKNEDVLTETVPNEVKLETGIDDLKYIKQLSFYTSSNRDPRGWVLSLTYLVGVDFNKVKFDTTNANGYEVKWVTINEVPQLAFDHNKVIRTATEKLNSLVQTDKLTYSILGRTFALKTALDFYNSALNDNNVKSLTTSNFMKIYGVNHQWFKETKKCKIVGRGRPTKIVKLIV